VSASLDPHNRPLQQSNHAKGGLDKVRIFIYILCLKKALPLLMPRKLQPSRAGFLDVFILISFAARPSLDSRHVFVFLIEFRTAANCYSILSTDERDTGLTSRFAALNHCHSSKSSAGASLLRSVGLFDGQGVRLGSAAREVWRESGWHCV
jgi:hypothetical protein